LARIYAGLQPSVDSWASQSELADAIGVTPARVSQLTTSHRARWAKQSAVTELRRRLRDELGRMRVASVDQLATRLVAASTDPADTIDSAAARAAARGLVRVATLTEESLAEPGWILRRRGGAELLAVQATGTTADQSGDRIDPGDSAQALADYAVALAAQAGRPVADEQVVSRARLVAALVDVAAPPGADSLPSAHLAELAADLCTDAAVNARLELYPPGLAPVDSLRAARRALLAPEKPLSAEDVAAKVGARFPAAADLPGRPELDQLLADAGTELVWVDGGDPARTGYFSPRHDGALSSAATRSVSQLGTSVPRNQIPTDTWDSAAEFEARLVDAGQRGRSLVLMTDRANVGVAARELERLVSASVSVDEWLIDRLRAITADGKPTWETLTAADAAGEAGPAWGRLQSVVDRALDQFTERLLATEGTVLLTEPGLLARYDRLSMVATWRDAVESRMHPLQAVWLLVPAAGAGDQPMLNGRAVPVTSRNQWGEIPSDWLRTGARVAGAGG
jgi:DNA-binding transcriptional regulator YdaS (Cro superfamily)